MSSSDEQTNLLNATSPSSNGDINGPTCGQKLLKCIYGHCFTAIRIVFVYVLTCWWPLKREKNITLDPLTFSDCGSMLMRPFPGLLHILLIIFGVASQIFTCFSRQNPYAHWVHHPNDTLIQDTNSSTQYCLLKCDINKNFITGFIFPDAIIVLLALWIYLKKPVAAIILSVTDKSCTPLKDFLKINDSPIEKLIKETQCNDKLCCTRCCYTLISILYIILSLSISILYLYAFGILTNDVVMQSPIKNKIVNNYMKDTKLMTGLSLLGFFAFDLLYIQVIIRYSYQCTLLVNYLNSIKSNLSNDKVENAYEFLKELNANSATIQTVIVIAGFTAISCGINLFDTTDCPIYSLTKEANSEVKWFQILQVTAVTLRGILWTWVVLFPFYRAAQVNEASRKLTLKIALYHPEISKGAKYIATEIRLIGISVRRWLPCVVILVIFFVIMMGANITSYLHFL